MNLELKQAYPYPEEVKNLFEEYTGILIEGDSRFQNYLQLQNYAQELDHLEEKYGLPDGRLYLAYCDGVLAGCIGLRKLDEENCEMKRLYVRPDFRRRNIGGYLVKKILEDAREIGYAHVLLDTLPFLETAIRMYKQYGFYEIPSYNNSPMDNLVYLKLDL